MENVVQMAWPFILMGVIFYFMIYRPQKRDQKKRANMLDSLKVGTRIVTIGGIFGEIAKIKDDRIRIKVAEDVEIWIRRAAVGTVITTELQKAAKEEKSESKAGLLVLVVGVALFAFIIGDFFELRFYLFQTIAGEGCGSRRRSY